MTISKENLESKHYIKELLFDLTNGVVHVGYEWKAVGKGNGETLHEVKQDIALDKAEQYPLDIYSVILRIEPGSQDTGKWNYNLDDRIMVRATYSRPVIPGENTNSRFA